MMATLDSSNTRTQNEIYTYIAIPLEALQEKPYSQDQALKLPHSIIYRAQQPITIPENMFFRTVTRVNNVNSNETSMDIDNGTSIDSITRPSVIENNLDSNSNVRNSVILKLPSTNLHNKTEVQYLKWKSSQTGDVNNKSSKESQSGSFKCSICGEILKKVFLYRKHMQMHRNTKKYKCEECSASYNVEDNLKLHIAMHAKGDLVCPICKRKFQRLASLKAHIIIHEVDEIFTCVECLAEYEKEDDLIKHMESHKQDKMDSKSDCSSLVCSFCGYTFQDRAEYKQHVSLHIKIKRLVMNSKRSKRKIHTNKPNAYKCVTCKKSFSKLCLLERHSRIHSGEKPFVCNICDRAFNQKGTLQIHLSLHTGVKPFHCTLCPAKFCQKGNLRVHVEKTHVAPPPGQKVYKCTMCTCIFKKVSSLNSHITRAHAVNKTSDDISTSVRQLKELEKQLQPNITKDDLINIQNADQIEICSESEVGMVKYIGLVDSSIEGNIKRYWVKKRKIKNHSWYICSYCTKEFKKPSDLIRHIRVHTREKPFKCKQCDQAFSLKSTLLTHITTHIGRREYQCYMCSKVFTSAKTLNSHIRKHEKNKCPHLMCNTCNITFNTTGKAKHHVQLHNGDASSEGGNALGKIEIVMQQPIVETPTGLLPFDATKSQVNSTQSNLNKIKPYKCDFCKAAFTKNVHLKRHMLIHSGDKKFKCSMCSKSFYFLYALREHLRFHSGERNFNCKICGKAFVTNAMLKRHLLIHTSVRPYICPYCAKRFKTVRICRKHINIHKKHLNVQVHALNETGELENIENSNILPTTDLNEPLTEAVFSNTLADTSCNLNLPLNNLSSTSQIIEETDIEESSTPINFTSNSNSLQDESGKQSSLISKILYTDENGIIVSNNPENAAHQNDPLLITNLNELQDPLTTNMGLNSLRDFEYLQAPYEMLMPFPLLHMTHSTNSFSSLSNSFPNIISNVTENTELNQVPLSYIGEITEKSEADLSIPLNNKNCVASDFEGFDMCQINTINMPDGTVVRISFEDETIIANVLYTNELIDPLTDPLETNGKDGVANWIDWRDLVESSDEDSQSIELTCTVCKRNFISIQELRSHMCTKTFSSDDSDKLSTDSYFKEDKATITLENSTNQQTLVYQNLTNQSQNSNFALMESATTDLKDSRADLSSTNNDVDQLNFSQENVSTGDSHTLFINVDNFQPITSASLYNTSFAQLKQNDDPLLITDLNGLQDPNVLLTTDMGLNSLTDFQYLQAPYEMLMPFPLLHMTLSNNSFSSLSNSFPNIISNVEENTELNQVPLSYITETTEKSEANLSIPLNNNFEGFDICQINTITMPDGTVRNSLEDGTIISNMLYTNNQVDPLKDPLGTNGKDAFANCIGSIDLVESNNEDFQSIELTCTVCKSSFTSIQELRLHMCSKTFNSDNSDKLSKDAYFKKDKVIASNSNKTTNRSLLRSKGKIRNKDKKYKCKHCDKIFTTKNALAHHVSVHKNKTPVRNNSCSYCGKNFKKRSDLERHIRTHTGEKPFGCDKCGKHFSLKSTLGSHCRTHNPGGNKAFNCVVCGSNFSSSSSLRVHMMRHTGMKPYECSICHEMFRTSGHRKSHMTRHFKNCDPKKQTRSKTRKVNNLLSVIIDPEEQNVLEDGHFININDIASSSKDISQIIIQEPEQDALSLNQPIQVDSFFLEQLQFNNILLQDNNESLPFVQLDVDNDNQIGNMKSLLNTSDINNFDETPYTEIVVDNDTAPDNIYLTKKPDVTKDFQCDVCHKWYSSKSVLTKHKKLHKGNNKCMNCNDAFDSVEELNNHLKLHVGYRPYCCQLCTNNFSLEKNLKTHMKRIHGMMLYN